MTKSLLETDIFNYHTPEFFINMKNIPDKTSAERKAFVLEEREKCRKGININGVYIPGSLYFHLNYYKLEGDSRTQKDKKEIMNPTLRDNEWIIFNDYDICQKEGKYYLLFGGRQISKDLLNSSKLYKEDGEIEIGSCNVGDRIYDESGELTTIIGKYPQGVKPVYKMTLLDGREIFCGLEHNWYVWDKRKKKYFVKTTKDLLVDYKTERTSWINKRKNTYQFKYGIPNSSAVKYPAKNLTVDPYFLGLWLGDGSSYYSKITTIDEQIKNYLYDYADKTGLSIKKDGDVTYMLTSGVNGGDKSQFKDKNFIHNFLKESNLYKNKHIPKEYLYSSEEQRMELLRGLMDSDGSCDLRTGSIQFTSSIPALADDFYKLCRSLGINLNKTKKTAFYKKNGVRVKCKESEKFTLYTDKKVFKLSRKLENLKTNPKYLNNIAITNIEYVFDENTTCIRVDNNSHLFLTDNYTVTHNTECETSLCLRELSLYTNTEAIALFANSPYRDNFTKKIAIAITHGEPFMIIPNIDKDWSKDDIRFGITKPDNSIDLRGRLYIYNTQEGKKVQVASGKTPTFVLIDEAAASPFKSVLDVLEPALLTDFGNMRCSPMITFTGGETTKAEDAKNMIESPSSNQLTTTLDDGKVIGGRFMNGNYRKDCKVQKTFSEYIDKKTDTWLDNYPIMVTDFNLSEKTIEKEREEAAKLSDKSVLTFKRIFYPLTLEDVFLTESNNKFPREAIEQHQTWLKEHYEPIYVDLYRDILGKVQWRHSNLRPITKFPVKPSDDKLAPICIYEHPVPNAPNFTYCIGIDPINADESNDKIVSLFTICVYKRMISPLDHFKNQVVATYAGRPKELSDAHEIALMLAEYYNAIEGVLPEASENSIFQYFFLKKKGHFLANSFDLVTEINRKTSFRGKKGYPASTPNQRHGMGLLVEAANAEHIIVDEEGEESLTLGVAYEYDYMLLEEYKSYKGKTTGRGVHDGNYDRIISRYCAEVLAKYYDVKYPIAQYITLKKQEYSPRVKTSLNVFGVNVPLINTQSPLKDQKSTAKIPNWMKGRR